MRELAKGISKEVRMIVISIIRGNQEKVHSVAASQPGSIEWQSQQSCVGWQVKSAAATEKLLNLFYADAQSIARRTSSSPRDSRSWWYVRA